MEDILNVDIDGFKILYIVFLTSGIVGLIVSIDTSIVNLLNTNENLTKFSRGLLKVISYALEFIITGLAGVLITVLIRLFYTGMLEQYVGKKIGLDFYLLIGITIGSFGRPIFYKIVTKLQIKIMKELNKINIDKDN